MWKANILQVLEVRDSYEHKWTFCNHATYISFNDKDVYNAEELALSVFINVK